MEISQVELTAQLFPETMSYNLLKLMVNVQVEGRRHNLLGTSRDHIINVSSELVGRILLQQVT